jgi:hypothetical protein
LVCSAPEKLNIVLGEEKEEAQFMDGAVNKCIKCSTKTRLSLLSAAIGIVSLNWTFICIRMPSS